MASSAINWYVILKAVQTILELGVQKIGNDPVKYYIGAQDANSEFCPMVVISEGDDEADVVSLGKPANDRLNYRETKEIIITVATYKIGSGAEDNEWAAAAKQRHDLVKAIKDALSLDLTWNGVVQQSFYRSTENTRVISEDEEVLHIALITFECWQLWDAS